MSNRAIVVSLSGARYPSQSAPLLLHVKQPAQRRTEELRVSSRRFTLRTVRLNIDDVIALCTGWYHCQAVSAVKQHCNQPPDKVAKRDLHVLTGMP